MIGPHALYRGEIEGLCHPLGWLSDSVIDAYLLAIAEERQNQKPSNISAYFVDSLVTRVMAERPAKDPFKPSGVIEARDCWIPEVICLFQAAKCMLNVFSKTNIFNHDVIILPWHLELPQHWLCIGIHPQRHQIRLYDSLSPGLTRVHKNILKVCVHRKICLFFTNPLQRIL